jgi:hypothetical protein
MIIKEKVLEKIEKLLPIIMLGIVYIGIIIVGVTYNYN